MKSKEQHVEKIQMTTKRYNMMPLVHMFLMTENKNVQQNLTMKMKNVMRGNVLAKRSFPLYLSLTPTYTTSSI